MKIRLITILIIALITFGCTENERARNFGGESTVVLPKGQKLINATWKQDDLWYLTRPMKADEQPETYLFKEDSSYGLMNGTVTIKEQK